MHRIFLFIFYHHYCRFFFISLGLFGALRHRKKKYVHVVSVAVVVRLILHCNSSSSSSSSVQFRWQISCIKYSHVSHHFDSFPTLCLLPSFSTLHHKPYNSQSKFYVAVAMLRSIYIQGKFVLTQIEDWDRSQSVNRFLFSNKDCVKHGYYFQLSKQPPIVAILHIFTQCIRTS